MATIVAHDPTNFYPHATLSWEGAGWYAGETSSDGCRISHLGSGAPALTTYGTGYDTPRWANTPAQALGNYAGHVTARAQGISQRRQTMALKTTTVRLTDDDQALVADLQTRYGMQRTSDLIRMALRTLAAKGPVSSQSGRAYMSFGDQEYGQHHIRTMVGNEPGYGGAGMVLLVSVSGPGLPRIRITEDGLEALSNDDLSVKGTDGLVLFGRSKGDRPVLRAPVTG